MQHLIYLEEVRPRSLDRPIEVNIRQPGRHPLDCFFGLLGLAVFLNLFRHGPFLLHGRRPALTLMTLPTIIIASRASLKSAPPSIREAALGGRLQDADHGYHILPLALPGMLTGQSSAWRGTGQDGAAADANRHAPSRIATCRTASLIRPRA